MEATKPIKMYEKIHRRSGHIAVRYKDCMIVWGGYMEHALETLTSQFISDYHAADELWIYDSITEVWNRCLTSGDIPPRCSGSCALVHKDILYVFGGYHGTDDPGSMEGNSNQLYALDLHTMVWTWLHPKDSNLVAACDKLVGWVHEDKLYFFGGFGPPPDFYARFEHVLDPTTESGWPRGWNNQLIAYCPSENEWLFPRTKGPIPEPRAAHAAGKTGSKVFIFGGRHRNIRRNDLHCLNMDTMMWSGNLHPTDLWPIPEGRSWHSFTFISKDKAVVYGGLNQNNQVLSDCWLLDISQKPLKWTQLPSKNKFRLWHNSLWYEKNSELVVVGGHTSNIFQTGWKDHAEELVIINFTPKSLLRLCVDAVLSHTSVASWQILPSTLQCLLQARYEQYCS